MSAVRNLDLLFMALSITVFMAKAASATMTNEMTFMATPNSTQEGFTKDLNINCSFLLEPGSKFQTVISLILAKAGVNGTYREIAAVTSTSRNTASVKDSLGAKVTGQLVANGRSYIQFEWTYPTNDVRGSYQCQVFGMDSFGHPVTATGITVINVKEVDTDVVLQRLKQLEIDLSSKLNDVMTRLDNSRDAIMEKSTTYNGHTYFLSRRMWNTIATYDALCRLYGGYLAEIDNEQELNFIQNFLINSSAKHYVYIGGTDEEQERTWVYRRNGKPLSYFHWAPGSPSGQDCLMLDHRNRFFMNDIECLSSQWYHFLCEIPH